MKTKIITLMLYFIGLSNMIFSQTTILNESFEDTTFPPTGWSIFDFDGDANQWIALNQPSDSHSGNKLAAVKYNSTGNEDWLVTNYLSIPANNNINLSFWAKSLDPSYLEDFYVQASTDGTNWDYISNESSISATYTNYFYDLSSYSGSSLYLAIICVSVDKFYLCIDDILITASPIGVAPTPNFSATPTTINEGESVNFTDLSSGVPTSWNWEFGDGQTSSLQNPSHVYNTAGTYDVTLTVTNDYGSDIETKTAFITVTQATTPPTCDTIINFTGTPAIYGIQSPESGYMTGNNSYGDKSKAEYFASYAPYTKIDKFLVFFGVAKGGSSNVTFNILNQSGSAPSSVIAAATVSLTTIKTNTTGNLPTEIDFVPDVTIPGPFYFEVVLPTTAGDTVAIISNTDGDATANTSWEKWSDNTWHDFTSAWVVDLNLAISVIACTDGVAGTAPVANFSGTPTSVTEGGTVAFTDLSTNIPTSWSWAFAGGTPATSSLQNPSIVYNTVGAFNVSLTATNAYGSNSGYIANYISVNNGNPPTGQVPIIAQYYGTFVEGVTNVNNTFTVNNVDVPSGTLYAEYYLLDSDTNTIDYQIDNSSANGLSAIFDMGIAKPNSFVYAAFYDASDVLIDYGVFYLDIITKPDWLISGGTAYANSIIGDSILISGYYPINSISQIIPNTVKAIGNKHLDLINCRIEFDINYNYVTKVSTVSNTKTALEINTLDQITLSKTIPLSASYFNINSLFNLSVFVEDSIKLAKYSCNFQGMNFPVCAGVNVKVDAGVSFYTDLKGQIVLGSSAGQFGFYDNGTDKTKITARMQANGFVRGSVKVLYGAASATARLDITGRLGIGLEYVSIPSSQLTPLFGGDIDISGTVELETFWGFGPNKTYGPLSFYNKSFGNLSAVNKTISSSFNETFGSTSITYNMKGTMVVPSNHPMPSFGSRDNNLYTVWVENDISDNGYLLFTKLDSAGSCFTSEILVENNNNSISNPKVAIMPSGSALITWSENRYNSTNLPLNIPTDELLNSQDVWGAIYYNYSNSIIAKFRLADDTTNFSSGRGEGEANICMSTLNKGLITWVTKAL